MITQKCENCSFYLQCYLKRYNSFTKTHYGHCGKMKGSKNSIKMCDYVCGHWEDGSYLKEERAKSIKKTLYEIADHLIEIAFILKDE